MTDATKPDAAAAVVVTIDGPAGAGKSTVARKLAAALGYDYLDTGAIYRSVALAAKEQGVSWDDGAALAKVAASLPIAFRTEGSATRVLLGGRDVSDAIRTPDVSSGASRVSRHPEVRAALLGIQRRVGAAGRVVAEGRDCGTVVFPNALAKFFLTASAEERARRRTAELAAGGHQVEQGEVLKEIADRDERDRSRAVAPLTKADDALEIDSSGVLPDAVVARMADLVRRRGG
jgi:cytidylate kinase